YNAPVMHAEAQENKAVQLASLDDSLFAIRNSPSRIPDFKELIAKMQAEIPQSDRPQRRVFSPIVETQDSKPETYTNLYLAMVSSLNSNPKSKIENPKPVLSKVEVSQPDPFTPYSSPLTDVDPIYTFTTTFTYDALGRRTSMTHGNGVITNYTYDAASQLTRLAHQLGAATINSFDYTYDRVGNRTSKTSRDGAANYTYDTLNRLVQAVNPLPTNPLESFTYDPVGNRTNSNQNGTSVFNSANQLTGDANFTYQYDNNGNLTRKTPKTPGPFNSYEYDAENRLVRAVINGTTVNYRYDGLGRRIEKEVIGR
ncbi:MAG: RHS repeat protein, partial [Deltaproteobacteria bacterium]|nr:RHS repeat protein [Deltaproteobacteria bacterium]